MDLDSLDKEVNEDEANIKKEEDQEKRFQMDLDEAENMEVDDDVAKTIEGGDESGDHDDDFPDLLDMAELKEGYGEDGICRGWTKVGKEGRRPVVQLGPNKAPTFRTQKASQFDGIIPEDKEFNLTKQRRVEEKDGNDNWIFIIKDMASIQGVSYLSRYGRSIHI